MPVPDDRLAELKHEVALQCARFAYEMNSDPAGEATAGGLCSAWAFERILEGGPTAIGLTRLIDFMFSLRARLGEREYGAYEHVDDEPMEDGAFDDGIPY